MKIYYNDSLRYPLDEGIGTCHSELCQFKKPRSTWIQYMMEYYEKIFPKATKVQYHKWAEHAVDQALSELGDYFSFSYWRHQ
jgi:hypothetical protein